MQPKSSIIRVIVHACGQYGGEEKHATYDHWRDIAEKDDDVVLVWDDRDYFDYEQEKEILGDAILLGAVAPLVFIVIVIQTRSVFISCMGFLEILLSFGYANFIYKTVLGIEYFHFLNFLGVFILFGIGADDIFIITDAWKQSAVIHGRLSLEKRMHSTLCRAVPPFLPPQSQQQRLGNIVSNIPPLRLFGMITGFMVVFDWLLTITFLASALIIHARYFSAKKG